MTLDRPEIFCALCGALEDEPHHVDCSERRWERTEETPDAREDAPHEEGQARGREADDGRMETGDAAQRLQDRPQSHEPEAGGGDSPQAEWAVEAAEGAQRALDPTKTIHEWGEEAQKKLAEEVQRQAQAARERDLLGLPYKIRVYLRTAPILTIDMSVTLPWPEWLQRLQAWRGIALDRGFVPLEAIAHVVHLDLEGKPKMEHQESNVVQFKPKGPAA